jgi:hypothetical protein
MGGHRLIGNPGCGSAIVEAALALSGLPYETEMLDIWRPGPERDRLFQLNPLGQVPVLVLPDGSVMTESAAMVLHVIDLAPGAGLAPSRTHPAGPPSCAGSSSWSPRSIRPSPMATIPAATSTSRRRRTNCAR